MQQHEIEAWLGDNHGLDYQQIKELLDTANAIEARYPDPDDSDERDAALIAAHRVMVEKDIDALIVEGGAVLLAARQAVSTATAGLRELASYGVPEATFARLAGIDRMTVRKWAGKR